MHWFSQFGMRQKITWNGRGLPAKRWLKIRRVTRDN